MRLRLTLAGAGILLLLFGVFRLVTQIPFGSLLILALWLAGAILIHDGILSPLVLAIGWGIGRLVPPRARLFLQGALVAAGLVTVVAIPMIYRQGSQPASKALLQQNFGGNLTLLVGIIAGATLLAYAVRVARDQAAARTLAETETEDEPDGPMPRAGVEPDLPHAQTQRRTRMGDGDP